jgi:hypothetical protein
LEINDSLPQVTDFFNLGLSWNADMGGVKTLRGIKVARFIQVTRAVHRENEGRSLLTEKVKG